MKRPEGESTTPIIFHNGCNGVLEARNFGGVDPINWRFNSDTQNYDYIGEPFDEIDFAPVVPKQTMDQETPIIREVVPIR